MSESNEIFIKTENLKEKQEQQKLLERLVEQREKRKLQEKYGKIKSLTDVKEDDNDDEDAAEWYERTKQLYQKNKKLKNKDEIKQEKDVKQKQKQKKYTTNELKGLAIGHKFNSIKEGQQLILTLRDRMILDNDNDEDNNEDVLENVNLKDDERYEKNLLNKKKPIKYCPYDDDQFDDDEQDDDLNNFNKKKSLLEKYDEEINGKKKNFFRIGGGDVVVDNLNLNSNNSNSNNNTSKKISLSWNEHKIAQEYYTSEEMEEKIKFKKLTTKKGKKNLRKKLQQQQEKNLENFVKEEPEPVVVEEPRSKKSKNSNEIANNQKKNRIELNIDSIDDDDIIGPDEDLSGIIIDDEWETELQHALKKTRKIKLKEKNFNDSAMKIVEKIKNFNQNQQDNDDDERITIDTIDNDRIVLNATAEFCRNLGGESISNASRINRSMIDEEEDDDEEDKESIQMIKSKNDEIVDDDDDDPLKFPNNWNEVDMKNEENSDNDDRFIDKNDEKISLSKNHQPILEEEPDVSKGLAGALKLAMTKGYLDKETTKSIGATQRTTTLLQAQSYTIEEKFYDDDRVNTNRRDNRYCNSIQEFHELDGYRPDFKLDYVDEKGCLMNQKEAFRYLSHKFHGKGPGKNKIDKRMKKLEQESKLRQMSSTDTPLNTVKLLQDKQKELQKPYIVLSGGGNQQQQQQTKTTPPKHLQKSLKK